MALRCSVESSVVMNDSAMVASDVDSIVRCVEVDATIIKSEIERLASLIIIDHIYIYAFFAIRM